MNHPPFMDTTPAAFYHPDAVKTLPALFALLLTLPATACIWIDGTTLDGHHTRTEGEAATYLRRALAQTTDEKNVALQTKRLRYPEEPYLEEKEQEGVIQILEGRYPEAIATFQQSETEHPGRYSTAVNLGTAYELNGELEPALKWITEGIRRDPDSHRGTEWLHVEILKTRIKLKEDPEHLRHHHLIDLPDTYTRQTTLPIGGDTPTVEEIGTAIQYQLEERLLFVKPPDPVVADLLYTLALIEGRTNTVESGLQILDLATQFRYPHTAQITEAKQIYQIAIFRRQLKKWAAISLAAFAGIGLVYLAWRRKIFFLTGKAYRQHRAAKAAGHC
ncbi:MAG: hypothetical protein EOP88_06690 [Verrucomicrobiaceae bacterium]|nr:MAG: hypothetical protein EOP88_06690 [Verrucomicrobiaceae bacterium]